MTFDYAVCPHCGCHCEDDEYCAACGQMFHDEEVPTRNVSLSGLLGSGLRSLQKNFKPDHEVLEVDASDDPGLAHLPGNSFHNIWQYKQR